MHLCNEHHVLIGLATVIPYLCKVSNQIELMWFKGVLEACGKGALKKIYCSYQNLSYFNTDFSYVAYKLIFSQYESSSSRAIFAFFFLFLM